MNRKPTLFWKSLGDKQKTNLVLLHGWGTDSNVWTPLLDDLQQDYALYLVDLPGYGNSPQLTECDTFPALCELIYQEAPQNAFWLGWSLGGLLATKIALEHPDSVKGLMTLASSPCFIAKAHWQGLDSTIFAKFSASLQQDLIATLKKFIALQCLGDPHAKTVQRFLLDLLDPTLDKTTLKWGLDLLETVDLRSDIEVLKVPYLSILGSEDKIVPPQRANKSSQIIKKAAHLPFISHRQECAALIHQFIKANR